MFQTPRTRAPQAARTATGQPTPGRLATRGRSGRSRGRTRGRTHRSLLASGRPTPIRCTQPTTACLSPTAGCHRRPPHHPPAPRRGRRRPASLASGRWRTWRPRTATSTPTWRQEGPRLVTQASTPVRASSSPRWRQEVCPRDSRRACPTRTSTPRPRPPCTRAATRRERRSRSSTDRSTARQRAIPWALPAVARRCSRPTRGPSAPGCPPTGRHLPPA